MTETEVQTEGIKRECPHCHSNRIESMGFRDHTNKVRRFRCKECMKSHSRNADTNELTSEENKEETMITENMPEAIKEIAEQKKNKKNLVTVNVRPYTKERLTNIKIIERETADDIINRLIDEHFGKQKGE